MSKVLETLSEIISWIEIAISPTLIGAILGFLFFLKFKNSNGIIGGIIILLIGVIIGVIWATRIWKTKGTSNFMSRINAMPELDNQDLKNDK